MPNGFEWPIPGIKDLFQIALVAVAAFYVLRLLVRTRAIQILTGLILLIGLYLIARIFELELILYLMRGLFRYGAIAALIIFQPELRAALSRLGQNRMLRFVSRLEENEVVEELLEAFDRLATARIGAIVAFQRNVGLEEYAETGTPIEARVSADLIASIFAPYGPLHDGAVLIDADRIIAAGVILPLTQFPVTDRLGTRHRAALGLSEETDALVVVVSEETRQVSVAQRGRLERDVEPERLRELLLGLEAEVVE